MRDLFSKFTTTEDSSAERFGSTSAWIHAGSSTTAFTSTQNSLLSTAAFMRPMEATYPQRTANLLTYRSLFATNEANFEWAEWMVKNSSSTATGTGTAMNRKQESPSLGTKTSSQSWQITASITVTT